MEKQTFFEIVYILFAFVIIVTCIYGPDIKLSNCTGYCCSDSNKINGNIVKSKLSMKTLPKFVKDHVGPVTPGNVLRSNGAVSIVNKILNRSTDVHIPHKPIYNICKTAMVVQGGKQTSNSREKPIYRYVHKNKYETITLTGDKGTQQDLFYTIYVAQTLATKNGYIIMTGTRHDSDALKAWKRAVDEGVIEWSTEDIWHDVNGEHWTKGTFNNDVDKSVSEHILHIFKDFIGEQDNENIYRTSLEREEELREAYRLDPEYPVKSATGAVHGAVLTSLINGLKLVLEVDVELDLEHADHTHYNDFLNKYFIV